MAAVYCYDRMSLNGKIYSKNMALRIWGNLYIIICITHKTTTTFEMNMVGFPCVIQIYTKFANFNNDLK